MKTKVIIVLSVFLILAFDCVPIDLSNKYDLENIFHTSFANCLQNHTSSYTDCNSEHLFLNNVFVSSTSIISPVIKQDSAVVYLTTNNEITEEQIGLIAEKTKEFPENTELSIAFINNGRVNYYGIKRQNNTIVEIENQTSVFEIGSLTKVFTTTLLADYVNEGKIDLEENINNYLPFKLHDDIQISFKDLANHTSGLPRIPSNMLLSVMFNRSNPYKNYSENKLEKYLTRRAKISQDSVKSFAYSNLGIGLLGYTLTKIENTTYPALLNDKIFSKYGMGNSFTSRSECENKMVSGMDKMGKRTSNWDFSSLESAGAILSTAEDLSKFAMAQFVELNRELALTREITHIIDENRSIGLGWFISKTESGDIIHKHKGLTGGYTSEMAIDVKNKTGIVILSNLSGFSKNTDNIETLCLDLLSTFVDDLQTKNTPKLFRLASFSSLIPPNLPQRTLPDLGITNKFIIVMNKPHFIFPQYKFISRNIANIQSFSRQKANRIRQIFITDNYNRVFITTRLKIAINT